MCLLQPGFKPQLKHNKEVSPFLCKTQAAEQCRQTNPLRPGESQATAEVSRVIYSILFQQDLLSARSDNNMLQSVTLQRRIIIFYIHRAFKQTTTTNRDKNNLKILLSKGRKIVITTQAGCTNHTQIHTLFSFCFQYKPQGYTHTQTFLLN